MGDSFKPSERTQYQRQSVKRNWERYALALDMRLGGATLLDIGLKLGVSKERARQMVEDGRKQLAYRVFKDIERPLGLPHWGWTK